MSEANVVRCVREVLTNFDPCFAQAAAALKNHTGCSQKLRAHLSEYLRQSLANVKAAQAECEFYLSMLEYEVHDTD